MWPIASIWCDIKILFIHSYIPSQRGFDCIQCLLPLQVVKKHYGHFAKKEVTLRVRFERSEIMLNIPEDGLVTRKGWKIVPCSHPTVSEA